MSDKGPSEDREAARHGDRASPHPRFVTGPLWRHILAMTGAGAVGVIAIFLGDLANVLFLSLLGDVEVVAAVGYASSILFLATSVTIGMSIAAVALVAPALGTGDRARARRLSASVQIVAVLLSALVALGLWLALPTLLTLVGASGRAHAEALAFLKIVIPTLPALSIGMCAAAVLRSVGDGRRSMNTMLWGALVNTLLDPVLIFGFGLGIEGAALATAAARIAVMMSGLFSVITVHGLIARPRLADVTADMGPIARIAVPAILANIATPVSNAYVTGAMAPYGDDAVAAWSVIGRLIPIAFGALFSLSGAIGPIIGQNYGAGRLDRVRATLTLSLAACLLFTVLGWAVLASFRHEIVLVFRATGETADLILDFSLWMCPLFVFLGALFVANAACNTLGRPHLSTLFNWARATLGTIPFVHIGAHVFGSTGVILGSLVGAVPIAVIAMVVSYRRISALEAARRG